LNRVLAEKKTPSLVTPSKGEIEANVGSSIKTPLAAKKSKGKEKVPKAIEELLGHVDFHSLF
jgi:hypothetical protein